MTRLEIQSLWTYSVAAMLMVAHVEHMRNLIEQISITLQNSADNFSMLLHMEMEETKQNYELQIAYCGCNVNTCE